MRFNVGPGSAMPSGRSRQSALSTLELRQFIADAPSWIGRRQTEEDLITAAPRQCLAATLGTGTPAGDVLPALWHWLYFLQPQPGHALGADGLARSQLLPPVRLPVAMWAGGQLRFHRPCASDSA